MPNTEKLKPLGIVNKQLTQLGINRALWKLLMNKGGKLRITAAELSNLPVNAALKAEYLPGSDSFVITAIVKQPTNIIQPNSGLIIPKKS